MSVEVQKMVELLGYKGEKNHDEWELPTKKVENVVEEKDETPQLEETILDDVLENGDLNVVLSQTISLPLEIQNHIDSETLPKEMAVKRTIVSVNIYLKQDHALEVTMSVGRNMDVMNPCIVCCTKGSFAGFYNHNKQVCRVRIDRNEKKLLVLNLSKNTLVEDKKEIEWNQNGQAKSEVGTEKPQEKPKVEVEIINANPLIIKAVEVGSFPAETLGAGSSPGETLGVAPETLGAPLCGKSIPGESTSGLVASEKTVIPVDIPDSTPPKEVTEEEENRDSKQAATQLTEAPQVEVSPKGNQFSILADIDEVTNGSDFSEENVEQILVEKPSLENKSALEKRETLALASILDATQLENKHSDDSNVGSRSLLEDSEDEYVNSDDERWSEGDRFDLESPQLAAGNVSVPKKRGHKSKSEKAKLLLHMVPRRSSRLN
ncbi:OLC1v1008375C1 [Oldenlandia corymbosa var. corymbosa]|uniref:OLC1v1008375C1 n=1 Tax=Oldenlandia corymbosa var. corymbosa TaxID=529605 RepID=A0AAV1DP99_OLDCO|nr:OLC1v1008375C1 [Oldenlandia corymbosa var. corymbosa]